MAKPTPPLTFAATGVLQLFLVPGTGRYLIEAAGAEGGGNNAAQGGKGARLRGIFNLKMGEVLNLVIGKQGLPGLNLPLPENCDDWTPPEVPAMRRGGGGGGGTFVWKSTLTGSRPEWPLLAAGGGGGGGSEPGGDAVLTNDALRADGLGGRYGHGGASDMGVFYYGGGGGTGWLTPGAHGAGPTFCQGGSQWAGGVGASFGGYMGGHGGYGGGGGGCFFRSGAGGGGGFSGGGGGGGRTGFSGGGGGSFNAGQEADAVAGVQTGDGWVKISCLTPNVTLQAAEPEPSAQASPPPTDSANPIAAENTDGFQLPKTDRWQFHPKQRIRWS